LAQAELHRRIARRGDLRKIAMPLHLDRIDWMPSPPLAPDDGPIDIAHLKRMTLGDASLEREVLAMFSAQAAGLVSALAGLPSDGGALAHTLKGSARGIGAWRVARAAELLENAAGGDGGEDESWRDSGHDLDEAIAELKAASLEASVAIVARLTVLLAELGRER